MKTDLNELLGAIYKKEEVNYVGQQIGKFYINYGTEQYGLWTIVGEIHSREIEIIHIEYDHAQMYDYWKEEQEIKDIIDIIDTILSVPKRNSLDPSDIFGAIPVNNN